ALYTRLNGASIGASVYDITPDTVDGSGSPYVTIGRAVVSELDTQSKNGFAAQIRIHTHSRTGSMLECKTIQGAIYAALHRSEMTITGFSNFSLLREDTDCLPEQDGRIEGVCEYRALIESA
ncbi:MAG: DUF3168 domain-containing protein, partial [Pikeienuella sp.]